MSLNKEEAQATTLQFTTVYRGALALVYYFRETVVELYGRKASKVDPGAKGGYACVSTEHDGKVFRGRVDVPLANAKDAQDLLATLRHEVLGHYGLNTLEPGHKRALLDGIIAAQGEPLLKAYWADISRRYNTSSLDVRAEEVFALQCETLHVPSHLTHDLAEAGRQALHETCIAKTRRMSGDDLLCISYMVAERMRDRHLPQLTFPGVNEIARQEPVAVDAHALPPTLRQALTAAPSSGAPFAESSRNRAPARRAASP